MRKRYRPIHYPDYIAKLFPDLEEKKGQVAEGTWRAVRTVTFKVTDDCNLNCSYCYQTHKKKKSMSFETAKQFVDQLLSARGDQYISQDNTGGIVIEFIGGEPLLEIELIRRICDYVTERMILLHHPWLEFHRFSICTNGIRYFDKRFQEFLKEYGNWTSLSITIDGNKELHDACRRFPDGSPSYDLVEKAVKHSLRKYGNTGTKVTISPENIRFLYESMIHLHKIGFQDVHANCVFEDVWDNQVHPAIFYQQLKKLAEYYIEQELVESHYCSLFQEEGFQPLEEKKNENWCGATGQMLACDPDGILYPCIRFMETSLGAEQEPMVIGSLEEGIGVSKYSQDCLSCFRNITRKSQSTEECFSCPIADGCAWCTAYNYQVFGTPDKRATFICGMHRARALANVYFWNTYYRKKGLLERKRCFLPYEKAEGIVGKEEYEMLQELAREEKE